MKPLAVKYGVGEDVGENEGRILTLEFNDFFLVNVYVPNSQRDLARIGYRLEWEDRILQHLKDLDKQKPVVFCGDLNVAHHEIDLRNPRSNIGNSGFTDEERGKMTTLLESGFIDSFRYFHPAEEGAYTWWSYMAKVRERNIGWRIDYFIVSDSLKERLINAEIHCNVMGSDHCPVVLELN
jgi:exodeoxyribonuclease-3